MMTYFLEFSLILFLFALLQFFLLRHVANFNTQRRFIIGGLISSLVIPLLPSLHFTQFENFSIVLPEVLVTTEGTPITTAIIANSGTQKLWMLLLVISLFLIVRWIIGLIQIAQVINQGDKKIISDEQVIVTNSIASPCSFFSTILLPKNAQLEEDELRIIIAHEKLHIRFKHSIEKITMALAQAIFWWHPALWFFTKELDLVHEFEVDDAITDTHDRQTYSQILVNLLIYPPALRLTHPFSSNIKKRIMKMNNQVKHRPFIVSLALSLLITCSILIHSCSGDEASANKTVTIENQTDDASSFTEERIDTIVTFDPETYEESVRYVTSNSEVFKVVEQMPRFPGCDQGLPEEELKSCSQQKLLEFIYKNIVYPKKAKDASIEGMIVTQFTVGKDGKISNFTFPRTLSHGLEDSVRDMLNKMQNEITWLPGVQGGKKVNVQYTLPVKFKLEG